MLTQLEVKLILFALLFYLFGLIQEGLYSQIVLRASFYSVFHCTLFSFHVSACINLLSHPNMTCFFSLFSFCHSPFYCFPPSSFHPPFSCVPPSVCVYPQVMHNQSAGSGSEQFCDLHGFSPLGLDMIAGQPETPEHAHCDPLHTCQSPLRDSDPTGRLKRESLLMCMNSVLEILCFNFFNCHPVFLLNNIRKCGCCYCAS